MDMPETPNGTRVFRVLITEDERGQLDLLREILEVEGFDTVGCVMAKEAVDRSGRRKH